MLSISVDSIGVLPLVLLAFFGHPVVRTFGFTTSLFLTTSGLEPKLFVVSTSKSRNFLVMSFGFLH